jgi:hypothetical protein
VLEAWHNTVEYADAAAMIDAPGQGITLRLRLPRATSHHFPSGRLPAAGRKAGDSAA